MSAVGRHVLVSGKVQGVAFRHSTAETARRLGVAGWVRNLADGRVEAWIEGAPDAVLALLAWIGRGPPAARVEATQVSEVAVAGHARFEVRPSAR